jgi:hypothetical protein
MYGRLSYEYPSKRSAFRFDTRYDELTINGGLEPETPPLKDGVPVTTSLSDKLKYDGSLADHMGSDSLVKKPPAMEPADIILPFQEIYHLFQVQV